jgi:outer membrane murein-binding lipoprotein Lpp
MFKPNAELKNKLNEEQLKALNELFKDVDVVLEPQDNFIPKARFDEVSTQNKELKTNNEKLSTDLETAMSGSKDAEELKATIAKLQEENKATQEKYESDIKMRERDYLISDALRDAGARNPKAARALLNIDELKVVDGKLNGFDEQLKTLKESDAYLFEIDNNNQDPQPRLDKFGKEIKGDNLNAGDMDAEAIASKYGFGKKEN